MFSIDSLDRPLIDTRSILHQHLGWHFIWHSINILADSQSREPTYFLKTVDYYIWVGWLSTDCWSSIERQPRINQDTNQLLIEGWILIEVLFKCWLRVDQEYQLTLHCGCVNCTQSFCWEKITVNFELMIVDESSRYHAYFYSAFHKTFDKRFPKFVWNSWTSLLTWQFHYVVVNQIVNFETKLWISRQISLGSCEVRREQSSHHSV